jgi:glucan endo-1,3-beta-D-glucosidase
MRFSTVAATTLAAGASAASSGQAYMGFNSGAVKTDQSAKFKADWIQEFKTAQGLKGAPGKFNAVRLYTNVQSYSEDTPIEAFEAAIETQTYILLGIWTSGVTSIEKELSALQKAIDKWGSKFTDLVIGISIGSEDLYRVSATGVANKSGPGNGPKEIVAFINDYKKAFGKGPLAGVPIGHVDTWDVWPNTTNKAVIDAVDWIGLDEYPYYENGKGNDIKNAGKLFDSAFEKAKAAVGDKPLWVTETGWPTDGPDWDEAVPSVKNAKYYWDEVGCRQLFNKVPTFWYNLRDSNGENKQTFAITKDLSTTPKFDLSCPKEFDTPSGGSSSSSASPSATKSGSASATQSGSSPSSTSGSGSGSESGSGSGSESGSGSGSEGASGSGSAGGSSSTETPVPASAGKTLVSAAAAVLALAVGAATLW